MSNLPIYDPNKAGNDLIFLSLENFRQSLKRLLACKFAVMLPQFSSISVVENLADIGYNFQ